MYRSVLACVYKYLLNTNLYCNNRIINIYFCINEKNNKERTKHTEKI